MSCGFRMLGTSTFNFARTTENGIPSDADAETSALNVTKLRCAFESTSSTALALISYSKRVLRPWLELKQTLAADRFWPKTGYSNEIDQPLSPAVRLPVNESTTQVVVIRKGDRALVWKARGSPLGGNYKKLATTVSHRFFVSRVLLHQNRTPLALSPRPGRDERLDFRTPINCYIIYS